MESRDSYTPRKRRRARARALPDAGVAVSACGLAVWSFTLLIIINLLFIITSLFLSKFFNNLLKMFFLKKPFFNN
jgi:hypothetical protein